MTRKEALNSKKRYDKCGEYCDKREPYDNCKADRCSDCAYGHKDYDEACEVAFKSLEKWDKVINSLNKAIAQINKYLKEIET